MKDLKCKNIPKRTLMEKNSISNALSHISIESHALVEKEVNSKASYCIIVKSWMAFHLHLSIHFHYIHPSSASLLTQWIPHSDTHTHTHFAPCKRLKWSSWEFSHFNNFPISCNLYHFIPIRHSQNVSKPNLHCSMQWEKFFYA